MRVDATVAAPPAPSGAVTDDATAIEDGAAALFATLLGGAPIPHPSVDVAHLEPAGPVESVESVESVDEPTIAVGATDPGAAALVAIPPVPVPDPAPDADAETAPGVAMIDPAPTEVVAAPAPPVVDDVPEPPPAVGFRDPSPTVPVPPASPPSTPPTVPSPPPAVVSPPGRTESPDGVPEFAAPEPGPGASEVPAEITTPAFGLRPARDVDTGPAPGDPVVVAPAVVAVRTPGRGVEGASPLTPAPAGSTPSEQLSTVIVELRRHGDGPHEVLVQLDPPELGRLSMKVRFDNGSVHVELLAQHADARLLLRSQLDDLRASLDSVGLPTGSLDVGDHAAPRDHPDDRLWAETVELSMPLAPEPGAPPPTNAPSTDARVDVHL